MFSEEKRLAMINQAINDDDIANVRVTSFHGLTVKLAHQVNAVAIIRGLRLTTEYEVELNISFNNRMLNGNLYTVFYRVVTGTHSYKFFCGERAGFFWRDRFIFLCAGGGA